MKKILIIEDEKEVQENIFKILSFEGFHVLKADNGYKGFELAEKEIPDLILCDIQMPELNGFDVLKKIKENTAMIHIVFIFLTAHAEKSNFRQAMAFGADDFLAKPFTREELLNAVNSRLHFHDRQKKSYLKKIDELRQSISLSIPHEFFTPLSIIKGNLELLQQMPNKFSKKEILEAIGDMKTAADRLHKHLKNIYEYAEFEINHFDEQKIQEFALIEPINIKPPLEVALWKIKRSSARSDDFTITVEDATVKIKIDYLIRALNELIENAVNFSEKNDKITITARKIKNNYVIKIMNAGRGMTHEQISRIDAFMQFKRPIYEQQGLGLGIIISKKIAELFSGKLNIESEYGKYTIIDFIIPLAKTNIHIQKPESSIPSEKHAS